jgi:hypothetical protein
VGRVVAAAAAAAALALAGCGTPSADLFVVQRTGSIPGARLKLLVSDGGFVRCNDGSERELGSDRLLQARALARDLSDLAERRVRLAPGRGSVLSYSIRLEKGTVTFSDDSRGQTPAMRELALFTREVAKGVCRLPR